MAVATSTSPLAIVRAPTIREQVVARIREAIESGRFRPGERLRERELCVTLGVSRSSVREALTQLVAEDVLVSVPNGGLVVAVLTPAEAQSLYEVRSVLESLAARQFAQHGTDVELAELGRLVTDMKRAARRSADDFVDARDRFMSLLLAGTRNPVLEGMVVQIYNRLRRLRCASSLSADRRDEIAAQLAALHAALSARDAEKAAALSEARVARALEAARPQIEAQTTGQSDSGQAVALP